MTEHSEHLIDCKELGNATVTCDTCGAATSFDLTNEKQVARIEAHPQTPAMQFQCAFCGETLDITTRVAIYHLARFRKAMQGAKSTLVFRLPKP